MTDPIIERLLVDAAQPTPEGMAIDWDVEIVMRDGSVLRADVYRPSAPGRYPVLMSHGPYGKGLPFQVGYGNRWGPLIKEHPEICVGTSCRYANWETPDPERWIPFGYVCIRVDSRGAGCSPGHLEPFSHQETLDYYDCIEWAGVQGWSNGKIGLTGISYYAMNQWQVAALQPPHLAAICPFEGASDLYRDAMRHGGILNTMWGKWYPMQVGSVQNGLGERAQRNPNTGRSIAGSQTLGEPELVANRVDMLGDQLAHPLLDDYFERRNAALENITVPLLSCGNWGGQGLHLRGNVEGYLRAGSRQKWLELHGLAHWTHYYTDYGVGLQKRFFDHFLKGEDNGWEKQPPLLLNIRHVQGFTHREESAWPLPRTRWTPLQLCAQTQALRSEAPSSLPAGNASFDARSESLSFRTRAFEAATEFTGPMAVKLFVSSSTEDADLFLTLRLFAPDGKEVLFVGAVEPRAPITQGWLRASHRELDTKASMPWRPVHVHRRREALVPGEVYELDIELWASSIVIPPGHTLALTVEGRDFEHGLGAQNEASKYGRVNMGSGSNLHDDARDRPEALFGGVTTVHTGHSHPSCLVLPLIPQS